MSVLIARVIPAAHVTQAGERAIRLNVATAAARHGFAISPREAKRLAAELALLAREAERTAPDGSGASPYPGSPLGPSGSS